MSLNVCRRCTTKFAVGLHRCPQCTAEDAYLLDNEDVTTLPEPVEVVAVSSGDGAAVTDESKPAKAPAKGKTE